MPDQNRGRGPCQRGRLDRIASASLHAQEQAALIFTRLRALDPIDTGLRLSHLPWHHISSHACYAAGQQAANGPASGSPAKSPQSVVKKLGTSALKFWRVRDVSAK